VVGLGFGDVVVEIAQPGPVGGQGLPVEGWFAAGGCDGAGEVAGGYRLAGVGEQDGDVVEAFGVGDVGMDAAEGDRPDRARWPETVGSDQPGPLLEAVSLLAAELGPERRSEPQVLGRCGVQVCRRGGVVPESAGEQPEVVVDRAAVGDPGAAADVRASVGGEQLVEAGAQRAGPAAGCGLGGDRGKPQIVSGELAVLCVGTCAWTRGGTSKYSAFGAKL
jgi:hypothetical protein